MSKISKEGYEQIKVIRNALDSMYDKLNRSFYVKNEGKIKDIEKQYQSIKIFENVNIFDLQDEYSLLELIKSANLKTNGRN